MFRRIFLTAVIAGLAAGLLISLVQAVTTTPLLLEAETFESAAATVQHDHAEDLATEGLARHLLTVATNLLVGIGFALLIAGAFALSGRDVDGRTGAIWGVAGYAVFTLAPALGLPPEVPGSAAAELAERQAWWLIAVAGTALGLWLLVFGRGAIARALAILALISPHAFGAPEAIYGGTAPPELAAHFAAASLVAGAVFWSFLGWSAGTTWHRLAKS